MGVIVGLSTVVVILVLKLGKASSKTLNSANTNETVVDINETDEKRNSKSKNPAFDESQVVHFELSS